MFPIYSIPRIKNTTTFSLQRINLLGHLSPSWIEYKHNFIVFSIVLKPKFRTPIESQKQLHHKTTILCHIPLPYCPPYLSHKEKYSKVAVYLPFCIKLSKSSKHLKTEPTKPEAKQFFNLRIWPFTFSMVIVLLLPNWCSQYSVGMRKAKWISKWWTN